jgi:TRAP-type C4-dicarboxylate transport system permease small subunit
MQPWFVRTMDRVSLACAVAAALLLVASVGVITWMVIYRAMGNSTYWEIELSVYMMVAALFLGSPYCLATGGHIGVDLLSHYLPPRARRRLALVVAVVGLAVCVFLLVLGAELTLESLARGERTESTWRPYKWPLFLTMPLGMALTALQYVAEMLRAGSRERAP